ncbi:hypothetical protein PVK06_000132 [Gossypium arboreum]|uniref:Uncharacterized protein n=1 Tax=Gossypium arboreum TaxID=29729 RepID=A0ABR0QYN2_GOSAR|nr:hypothetical protein PVK06_000132 [Gossypium arboreum]
MIFRILFKRTIFRISFRSFKIFIHIKHIVKNAKRLYGTKWRIPRLKLEDSLRVTIDVAVLRHAPAARLAVAEPARWTTSGARAGSIADAIHAHAARLKPPGAAGPERCTANVVPVVPALLVPIEF